MSDAEANERRRHEVAGAASGAGSEQSGTVSGPGQNEHRGWGRAATAATGLARVVGTTARGMVLDAAAGLARAVEVGVAAADGRSLGLCTLPVRVVILSDEHGRPLTTPDRLGPALELADRVFTDRAGIRVRVDGIDTVTVPAPTSALDPRANRGLLLDEITGRVAAYRENLPRRPLLSVSGDPVTVVVVRSIAGRTTGCSLGMTADWVICQASLFDAAQPRACDETVLAHELGHALNLPHHSGADNLMRPVSSPPGDVRGTDLRAWQAAIMQANRHTVPPAG